MFHARNRDRDIAIHLTTELLGLPDSLPDSGKVAGAQSRGEALGVDGMPVRVAALRDGVAEDVVRVLAHAQVRQDQGVAIHLGADEAAGEPLQTLRRGNVVGLGEGEIIGRMELEFYLAVICHNRIKTFEMSAFGPRDDAPEQGVQRCWCDKKRSILESASGERLPRVGGDHRLGGP